MKRLICALTLLLAPQTALAQDRDCTATLDAFAGAFGLQAVQADEQQCVVSLPNGRLLGVPVAHLTMQVMDDAGDRQTVRFGVEDVTFGQTQFQIVAELLHDPVAGGDAQLVVTGANDSGNRFAANVTGRLAGFDSAGTAQTALTSLRISTLDAKAVLTPDLLAALRVDLSDLSRSAVSDALQTVSQRQIPDASRREFLRFAGATPNATGAFAVTLNSDEGFDILQMVAAIVNLPPDASGVNISDAIANALSGTAMRVTWSPGRR